MKLNLLTDFRDTYAGPWPRALFFLALVAFGGPLISALFFDEPISLKMFVGSGAVSVAAFLTGVWVKRHYPRQQDHSGV